MKKIYEILEKKDIYYGVLEQPKGKELLDWKPIKQLLFSPPHMEIKVTESCKKKMEIGLILHQI